ncbi:hypothetical protein [Mucilaginibacter flavidus]|uniref:hypothetical protein n=1 Tax=Mucilaginibacter flavidus TaxID=2949309 RepID=UPI0020939B7A|nr:hypothetical protein [Mucilaginibacter flavidus]MCO5950817.1 hypothetical protein [Mucilaginibacter flavidus]
MDQQLWQNILDFNLDEPVSAYSFSTRLENENFWTVNFAQGAIIEYKKFMYLAAVSEYMVSPSPIVDVIWHQHLVFTQSYDEFCKVLGKKIAHVPATHHNTDFEKFKSAGERTGRLYTENFGPQPPEFWEYEDMYGSLQMPQSSSTPIKVTAVGVPILLAAAFGAFWLFRPTYVLINNPDFSLYYLLIIGACFIALEFYNLVTLNGIIGSRQKCAFVFNLSALELVYLRKNKIADVINGVVSQLVSSGKVSVFPNNSLAITDSAAMNTPVEICVLQTIDANPNVGYDSLVNQMALKPAFNKAARAMDGLNAYVCSSKQFIGLYITNFVLFAIVFALGGGRLITGVTRDRPVTLIAIVLVAFAIFAFIYLQRLTSAVGTITLPKFYYKNIVPQKSEDDWEWHYFAIGSIAFAATFAPLASFADRGQSSGWGGGDSGSSGGSSCGSSCGGSFCGGCGGS